MEYPLQYYLSCFERMNCNKRKGETAPHKAVLFLAVIEEVRLGHITNGFVPVNDQMVAAFKREWRRHVGESELFNPVFETPFFHLDYEPFWELMKREPFGSVHQAIGAVNQLYTYVYARIEGEEYHTLEALNGRILELLDEYCSLPFKGSSRWEIFNTQEKPLMQPLPQTMYSLRMRKEVKLGNQACRVGLKTLYLSMNHFVEDLK